MYSVTFGRQWPKNNISAELHFWHSSVVSYDMSAHILKSKGSYGWATKTGDADIMKKNKYQKNFEWIKNQTSKLSKTN